MSGALESGIRCCRVMAHARVGWHADQLTYLGPYCTIASLSLGTPRAFRLRETDTIDAAYKSGKPIRTYEVNLGHNSLVLMNAGCQERFKHTYVQWSAYAAALTKGCRLRKRLISSGLAGTWTSDRSLPRIRRRIRAGSTSPSVSTVKVRAHRWLRSLLTADFHPLQRAGPKPRDGTPVCKCGMPA